MVNDEQKSRFKKRLDLTAYKIDEKYGIPKDLIIAQAAHESNWGESELTRIACNLFGMTANQDWVKAGNPVFPISTKEYSKLPSNKIQYWNFPGDIIERKPDGNGGTILKVIVNFRKYANWDASMWDWAKKIATSDRYKKAYEMAKANIPESFFEELQKAGYATDPEYSKKLNTVYEVVSSIKEIDNEIV